MNDVSTTTLLVALLALIVASGYFSGSETAMMALNRYRLAHLAKEGHRGARMAARLLERPDRLIGLILLGNNLINILAATISTIVLTRLLGENAWWVNTIVMTVVLLVFSEVTPKTLAAVHPERVAFPSSFVLAPLLRLLLPLVWVLNQITNGVLRVVGMDPNGGNGMALSREELRTVVREAGAMIPGRHQQMLFGILDLEQATVEDIMVPRAEIVGIDLDDDLNEIRDQIFMARHTRLPLYRGNLDSLEGILHIKRAIRLLHARDEFYIEDLLLVADEPYFVPVTADLYQQLLYFQKDRLRMAMVVDEYGDIEGLVTIDDVLEEVVGEFTTDPQDYIKDVVAQDDGTFVVDASASLRELNRRYGWTLPEDRSKTLNGLIIGEMESITDAGTSLRIEGYTLEVVQSGDHAVRTVRVRPPASENAADAATGEQASETRSRYATETGVSSVGLRAAASVQTHQSFGEDSEPRDGPRGSGRDSQRHGRGSGEAPGPTSNPRSDPSHDQKGTRDAVHGVDHRSSDDQGGAAAGAKDTRSSQDDRGR